MITIDFDPARNAIFDWINRAVNGPTVEPGVSGKIPVQRAEQGSPRQGLAFIEYKLLSSLTAIGREDELRYDEALDKFFLYGRREFSVQIDAIGEKSLECIVQVQQSLSGPIACQQLNSAGLSVVEDNSIVDATEFLETEHEPRHILDVRFAMALQNYDLVDGLDTIESVGLENQIFSEPLNVTISKP